MAVDPLVDVYPDAEVAPFRTGTRVETPDLATARLHGDWRSIDRRSITTPDPWIATLADARFDMARNVLVERNLERVVSESVAYHHSHSAKLWPPDRGTFDLPVLEVAGTVTAFRCFVHHRNHYHALVDGLPRLYPLIQGAAGTDQRIQVLVDDDLGNAERWFLERWLPDHMTTLEVPGDAFVAAERFIFPSFLTHADIGVLPSWYLDWFRGVALPPRRSAANRRFYIPRGDAGYRRVRNEDALIDALTPRGFDVISLTDLSLADQIALFHDAEAVVAAHGAGLANLLFGTDVAVVELFNSPFVRPHYAHISASVGHRWRYTLAHELTKNDDFTVDVADVIAHLDELGVA